MTENEKKGNMKCANPECGYDEFIHGGMKDMPYMKYGMYKCPKCGHDVQVAIDPSKASPCAIGTGGFPKF